ncbi:hypothetical protein BEWA_020250 [Theileria equi strain WA]|uniref:Uncharacterized protein n=1 Tax=Theileria equi strain WA TaxID=1537102 RepID=L0AW99_THEEQ|nr:hypothetical protein BEWA_020250 [Theileria equi strain WA]AFZ79179.1 hypothetical protein BEWA_020250 [Theileria equi strain WA]|eukprot:XP_004828845.1 hypothetical protein BEWA_020250 [Theileria equi strain WA]
MKGHGVKSNKSNGGHSINGTGILPGFEGAMVRFETIHLRELERDPRPNKIRPIRLLAERRPLLVDNSYSPTNILSKLKSFTRPSTYNNNPTYFVEPFKCPTNIARMPVEELDKCDETTSSPSDTHKNIKRKKETKKAVVNIDFSKYRPTTVDTLKTILLNACNRPVISFILYTDWRRLFTQNSHCVYLSHMNDSDLEPIESVVFNDVSDRVKRRIVDEINNYKVGRGSHKSIQSSYLFSKYVKNVCSYVKITWTLILTIMAIV